MINEKVKNWLPDEKNLKILDQYFSRDPDILAVYLFGSVLLESAGAPHDIDFSCLLFPEGLVQYKKIDYTAERTADLIQLTNENNIDLHILNNASPLLGMEVIRHGKTIHCKNDDKRIEFENKIRRIYLDTLPLRMIKAYYLKEKYAN